MKKKLILLCAQLNRKEMEEEVKYEKIFNGIGSEKVKVAQKFKENFDILKTCTDSVQTLG